MSLTRRASPPSANRAALRGVGAVFAVSLTIAGVGGTLVWQHNLGIVPAVLSLALASGIGLILGLASRHLLRGKLSGLRIAAAWAAVIVGLILLGFVTNGDAGIVFNDSRRMLPDWFGLLQVALGSLSALLALTAWPASRVKQRPTGPSGAVTAVEGSPTTASLVSAPASADPGITRPLRAVRRPPIHETQPQPHRPARSPLRLTDAGQPKQRPGKPTLSRLRAWANRVAPWRRRRVQLVGTEAHRCPYCLEPVEQKDPRGVKVCPICHTRHHADCWAVTGMCQVPHYHR